MIERSRPAEGRGRAEARLEVHQVRRHRFQVRPWRRGGLDPDEVHAFILRAAEEIDLLRREVAAGQAEIERLRVALHHWQTWHRHCDIPDLRWPISYECR